MLKRKTECEQDMEIILLIYIQLIITSRHESMMDGFIFQERKYSIFLFSIMSISVFWKGEA